MIIHPSIYCERPVWLQYQCNHWRDRVSVLILRSYCFPQKEKSHVLWTEEEKEAVFKYLGEFIKKRILPGKRECENCIKRSGGVLAKGDWDLVKNCVRNIARAKALQEKNSLSFPNFVTVAKQWYVSYILLCAATFWIAEGVLKKEKALEELVGTGSRKSSRLNLDIFLWEVLLKQHVSVINFNEHVR